MQKYIGVSFTLKGQELFGILPALKAIAAKNPDAILVHAFMPRELVIEKGLSTNLVDTLDNLFPNQLSFFKDGEPDREGMKNLLYDKQGTAYIIGRVKDGVREEFLLYAKAGVKVVTIEFNEENPISIDEASSENATTGAQGFSEADLVSFGQFIVSKERIGGILGISVDQMVGDEKSEKIHLVSHADIENWKKSKEQKASTTQDAQVNTGLTEDTTAKNDTGEQKDASGPETQNADAVKPETENKEVTTENPAAVPAPEAKDVVDNPLTATKEVVSDPKAASTKLAEEANTKNEAEDKRTTETTNKAADTSKGSVTDKADNTAGNKAANNKATSNKAGSSKSNKGPASKK